MHQWTNQKVTYSQGSQDLYLEKIFQVISHTNKYFVEFGFNEPGYSRNRPGANTQILYEKGWRDLLLDNHYENNMINLKKHYLFANNIASIFAENNVPKQPDFISYDMDSHDLWVIRSILQAGYRPRIFITEFNSNYHITDALTLLDPTVNYSGLVPNNFTFVFQQCAWGASAGALHIVAESHGYTMIGRIDALDLIWMRNDLPNFACFFDIDGVITKGPNFITVAKPAIQTLIQLNVPVVFVSNTCMLESDKAKQLSNVLGVTVSSFY
ncbi:unnamed protein product [Rotaria sp. Silwood2]|nr:unnamed protein product [Rotaria sp. Silwood2]